MTYIKLEDAVKIFNEIGLLDETKIVRLNQLQSIDFEEMIKDRIEKYEYLSVKYLQESDIKTGLIDFKRMSDVAKGTAEELKSLLNKLPK